MALVLGGAAILPTQVNIISDGAAIVGGDGADVSFTVVDTTSGGIVVGGDGSGPFKIKIGDCEFFVGTARHRGNVRLRDILFALKREIVDAGVFEDHQVYFRSDLAGQNENPPDLDNYLEIFLLDELSDQNILSGGGTDNDMRSERIEFRLYHRLSLDQKNRHTFWIIDQCLGASKKADELHSVIQLLDIIDLSRMALLSEPMRVQSPTSFQVDRRGWGFVAIRAEIIYTAELVLVP